MVHAAASHRFTTATPAQPDFVPAAPLRAPPTSTYSRHARHVLVGAAGFAAGVGTGTLYMAPRVVCPGLLGGAAYALQTTTGFLWRHLGRATDAPQATGLAADGWRGLQHGLEGVMWGLMLPAAFGPALGIWLGVAIATACVAYALDEIPPTQTDPVSTWALCGAVAHGLSDLLTALWLQLVAVQKSRSRPEGVPAGAVWRVEMAHSQARARQAWDRVAAAEQNVWHQAGLDHVLGAPSWASAGRAGWSVACAFGAWYAGASTVQALGIGTSVAVALLVPQRAMAHAQHTDVNADQAAQAGHALVHHVVIAAFGMSYYAR